MAKRRMNIFIDDAQWNQLTEHAKRMDVSAGHLARIAIRNLLLTLPVPGDDVLELTFDTKEGDADAK